MFDLVLCFSSPAAAKPGPVAEGFSGRFYSSSLSISPH